MKTQFSMQKAKIFATQLLWEFIGSVFIAAGIYNFAVQAKFPMTGFSGISIILYKYHIIPVAEYSDRTFNHCIEYPAGYCLLSASREKVLYQFFTVHGALFFDDRLCGTIVSGV